MIKKNYMGYYTQVLNYIVSTVHFLCVLQFLPKFAVIIICQLLTQRCIQVGKISLPSSLDL